MPFHLAQLNIATLIEPLDSPRLADFVAALPSVNTIAEAAPGFVWRLVDDSGADATALRPFGPDVIVNLTVWESVETLREFVFRSGHVEPLRRRREWFHVADQPYAVLWWVPAGHIPTVEEGRERLTHYQRHGATPFSFWFSQRYPAPVEDAVCV